MPASHFSSSPSLTRKLRRSRLHVAFRKTCTSSQKSTIPPNKFRRKYTSQSYMATSSERKSAITLPMVGADTTKDSSRWLCAQYGDGKRREALINPLNYNCIIRRPQWQRQVCALCIPFVNKFSCWWHRKGPRNHGHGRLRSRLRVLRVKVVDLQARFMAGAARAPTTEAAARRLGVQAGKGQVLGSMESWTLARLSQLRVGPTGTESRCEMLGYGVLQEAR